MRRGRGQGPTGDAREGGGASLTPSGYAHRMTGPKTATRLVCVRLIHPHTVHELDCPKRDLTLTKRRPKHYGRVPIGDVPIGYPRCKSARRCQVMEARMAESEEKGARRSSAAISMATRNCQVLRLA